MRLRLQVLPLLSLASLCVTCHAFVGTTDTWSLLSSSCSSSTTTSSQLYAANSPLPRGISPFEKSVARGLDVQADFRKIASKAVDAALRDGQRRIELDFPPLLGGDLSKTAFDDFDNLQELDANRDWCVQFLPLLNKAASSSLPKSTWLVLPDDKECELAKSEWGGGQLFRRAAQFTSIRAALTTVAGEQALTLAWGTTIASTFNKLSGGDGILADASQLDDLSADVGQPVLQVVCQPGNGGPVEDWINVEQLHQQQPPGSVTCIVNGALDKVRDGYYPAVFFPALAKTVPFYRTFEAAFCLKPISDKGLYGWLYRVYPEPWQVVWQSPRQQTRGDQVVVTVDETVVLTSETRPTFAQAVQAMMTAAAKKTQK